MMLIALHYVDTNNCVAVIRHGDFELRIYGWTRGTYIVIHASAKVWCCFVITYVDIHIVFNKIVVIFNFVFHFYNFSS